MQSTRFFLTYFFIALFGVFITTPSNTFAGACSPGIPCTSYNIYDNNDAGRDVNFNALKTGVAAPYENACDGNFMNRIHSRAFMEANREVIMSEQIIHKPDSVLEYTCFDQYVAVAGEHAGPIFSESEEWENRDVCRGVGDDNLEGDPDSCDEEITVNHGYGDDHLDNVLEDFLFDIMTDYIDTNFDHTFLGGSLVVGYDTGDIDGDITDYACSNMETVWIIAKCLDFGEDDLFRTFEHFIEQDPRSIPQSCSPGNDSNDSVDPADIDNTFIGYDPDSGFGGVFSAEYSAPSGIKEERDNDDLERAWQLALPVGGMLFGGLVEACPDEAPSNADVNTGITEVHSSQGPPINPPSLNDILRVMNNCAISDTRPNGYSSVDLMRTYTGYTKGVGVYLPGTISDTPENPSIITTIGSELVGTIVACAAPIPTGVPVITYDYDDSGTGVSGQDYQIVHRVRYLHYDHVCPNPGCYYQPVRDVYTLGSLIEPLAEFTDDLGQCLPILVTP